MFLWQSPVKRFLPNQVEISNTIRRYWVDTARWLRNVVYSNILNLGNHEAIEARLNQTADAFGALFTQFYGQETGNRVRASFLQFFDAVKEMVEAYQINDAAAIEQQRASMYAAADELAEILSQVNRYWDRMTLQALLHVLAASAESQIANIATGNYEQEIEAYDQFIEQIYRISDEFTYGILRQFQI